ncbi:hypothetical protein [Falsirhodobacter algicola]|uniref:Uncharacterized protein n=1 Tax=Falsirhodobacter algicola TaxID=2692330 RepID=A0A8J8MS25_9RHOB|nr:hypothetical protein [Falsirhodobacter algicola]QUS35258.1 hypothetical protein GR316_02590 [Falsirhodobacter algicola]
METLLHYAPLLSAALGGVTALIWVVYLNAFLSSYHRQSRPSILITSGAGRGMDAHCFVTNLGLEPIYLLDLILDLTDEDGNTTRAVIPERNEKLKEALDDSADPRLITNLGPLGSGEAKQLGRFSTLVSRACDEYPELDPNTKFTCLELTVVAVTASRAALHGAKRCYVLCEKDERQPRMRPTTIKAEQIDNWFGRRALARQLRQEISARDAR